jgi:hypothetical protein
VQTLEHLEEEHALESLTPCNSILSRSRAAPGFWAAIARASEKQPQRRKVDLLSTLSRDANLQPRLLERYLPDASI